MKTLTSMTDFVLEQENKSDSMGNSYWKCKNYAKFLKKPLAIYQFVPCKLVDGQWVFLEEPKEYKEYLNLRLLDAFNNLKELEKCALYQEASDKVLFEGFENSEIGYVYLNHEIHGRLMFDEEIFEDRTIEDLVRYDLPLTKTALKEIGL